MGSHSDTLYVKVIVIIIVFLFSSGLYAADTEYFCESNFSEPGLIFSTSNILTEATAQCAYQLKDECHENLFSLFNSLSADFKEKNPNVIAKAERDYINWKSGRKNSLSKSIASDLTKKRVSHLLNSGLPPGVISQVFTALTLYGEAGNLNSAEQAAVYESIKARSQNIIYKWVNGLCIKNSSASTKTCNSYKNRFRDKDVNQLVDDVADIKDINGANIGTSDSFNMLAASYQPAQFSFWNNNKSLDDKSVAFTLDANSKKIETAKLRQELLQALQHPTRDYKQLRDPHFKKTKALNEAILSHKPFTITDSDGNKKEVILTERHRESLVYQSSATANQLKTESKLRKVFNTVDSLANNKAFIKVNGEHSKEDNPDLTHYYNPKLFKPYKNKPSPPTWTKECKTAKVEYCTVNSGCTTANKHRFCTGVR